MTIKSLMKPDIKVLLLSTFFLLVFAGRGVALDVTAKSCSKSDVQSAITQVQNAGGGTVYIPPGDCTWEGYRISIDFNGNINIIGAGVDKTILRLSPTASGYFGINEKYSTNKVEHVRISGMSLLAWNPTRTSSATLFYFAKAKSYRLDNLYAVSNGGPMMIWKNVKKGLVDHCKIVQQTVNANCGGWDSAGYGLEGGSCYDPYPPPPACVTKVCNCSVGSRSVNRNSSIPSGNTVVAKLDLSSSATAIINNPGGSGKGKVQRIYIFIKSAGSNPTVDLASFSAIGNALTTGGTAPGIKVHEGLNILTAGKDFTAFAINAGDYIGVYLNSCTLASGQSFDGQDSGTASNAHWIKSGNNIPSKSVDFGTPQTNNISLWAEIYDNENALSSCEAKWESWYTATTLNRGGGFYSRTIDVNYKPTLRDDEAHFFEDNVFQWVYAPYESNWGSLHKVVFRNNEFNLPAPGLCKSNASGVNLKPGVVFGHIYNNKFNYYSFNRADISFESGANHISMVGDRNKFSVFTDMFSAGDQIDITGSSMNNGTFTIAAVSTNQITTREPLRTEAAGAKVNISKHGITPSKTPIYMRGSGLIYNNVYNNFGMIYMINTEREYSDFTFTPTARPQHIYMWNNTYHNVKCGSSDGIGCAYSYESGVKNGLVGLYGNYWFRAPQVGEALYGFGEYPYPHPWAYSGDNPSPPKGLRIIQP